MKRSELEELKAMLKKGKLLADYDVEERPLGRSETRPGFLWQPFYSPERKAIGWEEVPDPDYVAELDGDYTRPIPYADGMSVTVGLFYTDGDNIWEAVKSGKPKDFSDKEYFDIIG